MSKKEADGRKGRNGKKDEVFLLLGNGMKKGFRSRVR